MIIQAADYAEGLSLKPPRPLELALQSQRYRGALPYSGGILDQPAGLLESMEICLAVFQGIKLYLRDGRKPGEMALWKKNNVETWNLIKDVEELRRLNGTDES